MNKRIPGMFILNTVLRPLKKIYYKKIGQWWGYLMYSNVIYTKWKTTIWSVAVFRTLFGDGHWGSSSQKTLAIWLKPQTSFGSKTEIEMSQKCDPKMVGPSLAVLSRSASESPSSLMPWPRLVPSQSPHLCPCHPMWLTECRSIPWWKKTCSIMFLYKHAQNLGTNAPRFGHFPSSSTTHTQPLPAKLDLLKEP